MLFQTIIFLWDWLSSSVVPPTCLFIVLFILSFISALFPHILFYPTIFCGLILFTNMCSLLFVCLYGCFLCKLSSHAGFIDPFLTKSFTEEQPTKYQRTITKRHTAFVWKFILQMSIIYYPFTTFDICLSGFFFFFKLLNKPWLTLHVLHSKVSLDQPWHKPRDSKP